MLSAGIYTHGRHVTTQLLHSYVRHLGLNNLYRCDLVDGWRLTYTLSFDGVGIRVDVIEVMAHQEYDRRFGY